MKFVYRNGLVVFCCSLLLVLILLYAPYLLGRVDFFFEDHTHFFEPLCRYISSCLQQGQLPLWNPYSYCGMSQLAISSPGIFYPFIWLFVLLPYSQALSWSLVVHQLIAGVALFLLARSCGLGFLAASMSGSVAALSGYMFAVQSNFTLCYAAAWFCLTLWSTHQLAGSTTAVRKIIFTALSTLSVALMVLSGRPEIFVPGIIFLGIFSASLSSTDPSQRKWVHVSAVFLRPLALGLLLAMPSLLPSAEWVPWSRRSEGLPAGEVLLFSANWYDFLGLFLGQPLGDLQSSTARFLGLVASCKWMPYISSAFVGTTVITAALWGILSERKRIALPFILLFALSLTACAGMNIPGASALVEKLSIFSMLRFPVKLLFFCTVALAVLGAVGLQDLADGKARKLVAVLFGSICLSFGVLLFLAGKRVLLPFETDFSTAGQRAAGQLAIAYALIQCGIVSLLINAAAQLVANKQRGRLILAAVLLGISCVALVFHASAVCNKSTPGGYFNKSSSLAQIMNSLRTAQPDSTAGRFAGFYMESFKRPKTLLWEKNADANAYQYDRQILFSGTFMDSRTPAVYGFEGSMVGEYYYYLLNCYIKSNLALPKQAILSPVQHIASQAKEPEFGDKTDNPLYRLLQSASCLFLTTQMYGDRFYGAPIAIKKMDPAMFRIEREDKTLNVRIYRVLNTCPRAYLSYLFRVFPNRDSLIEHMFTSDKSGYDPAAETLLEEKASAPLGSKMTIMPLPSKVIVNDRSNSEVEVSTESKTPGMLVLADQYYPGWKVRVDGEKEKVYRVNGFFRGVIVPAGKHQVMFTYEPESLYQSLLLVLAGAVWFAAATHSILRKSVSEAGS